MFRMTSDIKVFKKEIAGQKPVILSFKPSSLNWKVSVDNLCDTASLTIPTLCRLKDKFKHYENVSERSSTAESFNVGDRIEIYAGYDGKNDLQFKGFITRINFTTPLNVDCEGYSYQLRKQIINKSFGKTTVNDVLKYLIQDTDIKLSAKMPKRIDFEPHPFNNKNGIQVIEFLKEKYFLSCFFEYDNLFIGHLAAYKSVSVKHRLDWNVVNSPELLFSTYTGSIVLIQGESQKADGTKLKIKATNNPNPGAIKKIKLLTKTVSDMQLAVNAAQDKVNQKGFSGSITTFLKPFVRPGMTTVITDEKHKERQGSYFVESVEGSFGTDGGRQKIGIAFKLSSEKAATNSVITAL